VLAQEWRFLLQVERPDAEDKGCERGSARKAMDETNKEVAGARSAAMERVKLLHTASPPPQFSAVFARCLWQSSVWMSPVSIVR
jgi:hypothetical protein